MMALSIQQPWAGLIINGDKSIENRTWRCHKRGRIYIHAGLRVDKEAAADLTRGWHPVTGDNWRPGPIDGHLSAFEEDYWRTGGIVGEAEIVDCVERSDDPWFVGPFGIVLRNVRPLPFQPCRGKLAFFVPELPS